MAGVVRRGMGVIAALSVLAKFAAFGANIILAWLLAPEDFGVYGAAIAVAAIAGILRDGGVRELLIQRGDARYGELSRPVFWYALTVSTAAAAVLAALAPTLAGVYAMPDLTWPLVVIAISMPISVPGSILRARLRIDLRFAAVGNVLLFCSLLRYASTIVFAWLGFGVLSFVLPLILIAIVEWVAAAILTGENLFRGQVRLNLWPDIFHSTKWLIVGAMAFMMVEQGDYLVAGLFVDELSLGLYFFGAQLLFQTSYAMLSYTAQVVLLPSLVKFGDELERKRRASMRFLSALMFMAAPMSLGLAVIARPLFEVLLEPKWLDAVLPLQILGALYPLRCTIGLTSSILFAQNRFKRNALFMILEGLMLLTVTVIVAWYWRSPVAIAAGVGISMATSRLLVSVLALRVLGASTLEVLGACIGAWTIALASAAGANAVMSLLPAEASAVVRLGISGGTFTFAYLALCRLFMGRSMQEALVIAPARVQPLAERMLGFRAASGA